MEPVIPSEEFAGTLCQRRVSEEECTLVAQQLARLRIEDPVWFCPIDDVPVATEENADERPKD